MAVIKLMEGKVVTKGGKPSCTCCDDDDVGAYLSIIYDWRGTGQTDLDSKTVAFGEQVGYNCGDSGLYVQWLEGGDGRKDDQSLNGFEHVGILADLAKANGLWTSSYNITCHAGWYWNGAGSGPATLTVNYKGVEKSFTINPETDTNGCVSQLVATVTIYSVIQDDGSFFEIS